MPDRILPALFVLLVVRKLDGDVSVDLAQGRPPLRAVLYRHGDQSDVAEGRLCVAAGVAGSVVDVAGVRCDGSGYGGDGSSRDGDDSGAVCGRGGCGGCGRRRRIAVGGVVKDAYRRQTLVFQMMVPCAGDGGVNGHHGTRTVQVVMGMAMVAQRDMMRRQTASQSRTVIKVLRSTTETAALQLGHEIVHWNERNEQGVTA